MNYTTKRLQQIHEAAMHIIENVGMKFHHPRAIEILKSNGIRCEGDVAYFTEEQILYWIRKAPFCFTLYGEESRYDCSFGGTEINPAPPYGAPFIVEQDGKRRPASAKDYVDFIKLFEANDDYKINGGPIVAIEGVDPSLGTLAMWYATYTHSNKVMMIHTGDQKVMDSLIEASEAAWGGKEALREKPRMFTIVDVNSPMQFGKHMCETLITLAEAGQAFTVANCCMAGSTSPVTLAGTVALIVAENFPVIALAQMVRPGTPVLLGSQSCTADMASGQIAGGSSEGALCYKYCANLSDFYGLPSRGGGAITDSKIVDPQATLESMITLMACYENNMNLIIHAAGILDGYNGVSYEKVLADFEVLNYIKRYLREFDINEDTLALEYVEEVGHTGEYLTSEHTFEYCRAEPMIPHICSRGVVKDPVNRFQERTEAYKARLLNKYQKPEIDPEKLAKIKDIFEAAGLSRAWMDEVDQM
ncbi:MAG: trimethylamine methyltransferase family protein [Lachnospiraceae bacterium]|nr:trimethylamine methyltransferase family protein [Lachnospiraceae bacterium]